MGAHEVLAGQDGMVLVPDNGLAEVQVVSLEDRRILAAVGMAAPDVERPARLLDAGQALSIYMVGPDKTVLIAVTGLDSDARRDGYDFVYMTCSEVCARSLKAAFEGEIELGKRMGLP
jgi:hypothetical protein